MNFDLLLKGGEVLVGGRRVTADVGVRDGLIVAVGRDLGVGPGVSGVRRARKWVLPGFIDAMGTVASEVDDGASASRYIASGRPRAV